MKTILTNLETILNAAIVSGNISAKKIFVGLQNAPELAMVDTQYPYVMIDDGGEDVEDNKSNMAQNRFYNIVIEMAAVSIEDFKTALFNLLTLVDEVKTVLELETSRQKDGMKWGFQITPFGWNEQPYFFRGRRIIVKYWSVEPRIFEY